MFRRHRGLVALGAVVGVLVVMGLLVWPGVRHGHGAAAPHEAVAVPTHPTTVPTTTTIPPVALGCGTVPRLDPTAFPAHVSVTNPWFPLVPGTRWVTSGSVSGSGHRVVTTVTDLTKVVDGVQTIVVLDQDFDGSELQESELAFFAQDGNGAIWGLGEYPEEYDSGELTGAPDTWISGVGDARAGIAMLPHPALGTPQYTQGISRSIQFLDCAQVFATGQATCEPTGCYRDVLVTDEWGPLDPAGGHQRKYYAAGAGLVRVGAIGGDSPEVLRLTSLTHGCSALASARATALRMDRRGNHVSPHVYARTSPVRETLHAPGC